MFMKKISILSIFFFLIASQALHAQRDRIRFEKLTSDQGLSQSSVLSICQDHDGFLWFGTYDGVCRYDGYRFKYFKHRLDDSTSLSQNSVRNIFEDRSGVLWISTEFGLNVYDRKKESFLVYFADPKNSNSLSDNRTRRILETKKGDMWICTDNGLTKYDRVQNIFTKYYNDPNNPNSISGNFVRVIFEDSVENLWIGTNMGLDVIDHRSGNFIHYKHDPKDPNSLSDDVITCIQNDRKGSLWIGTHYGGLNRLDPGSKKFIRYKYDPQKPYGVSYNYFFDLLVDRSGELWGATYGGGLDKYDRKNDKFIHYQKNYFDPTSISSNMIHCIYEDRAGIIYLGTDFGGINKIDPRKNQFIYYDHDPSNPRSLPNNNVSCFYEDNNDSGRTIWIGTRGNGIGFFKRGSEEFSFYRYNAGDPYSLGNDDIRCITKDHEGMLWIGTSFGLSKFDPSKGKFYRYPFDPMDKNGLSHYMVYDIYEDREGTVWIATNGGGLNKYDRVHNNFIHYQSNSQNPGSISDDYLWCMVEDRSGNLWIGTNTEGLNCLDKERRQFIQYKHEHHNPNSISDNKVLCLFLDHNGILWIGTAGGGLNRYDPQTKIFSAYYEHDGLSSNTVHAITEDDQYNLWISTNKGLTRFDHQIKSFSNYTVYDGLQSNEFHVKSVSKSITGEIFFGGTNGFNVFRPEKLTQNTNAPQIVLTDFRLFNVSIPIGPGEDGRNILDASISETEKINLSYYDEVISFEFAALDFTVPNNNMYAHMMEGFESNWNYVGNRHYATYTKLSPGRYIFKVKGSNNTGTWNNAGTSLEIIIAPPFWETLWFRLLLVFVIAGLLISGYMIRTARIRAHNRELQQKVHERTAQLEASNKALESFAYSVSHDLRTPLRTINDYTQTLTEDYGESFDAEGTALCWVVREQARRMVGMIDDLLEFSRVSYSSMNMTTIEMTDLAETVYRELTSQEARERIKFNLNKLPNAYGDPILIRQVWQNLLSNAIKYSSKKENAIIEIEGSQNENELIYKVQDSGSGFDMSYVSKLFGVFERLHKKQDFEGTGVGLAIVHSIISRHGGRVWAEGEVDKGATFYFTIPR
jgi:ligand-binding sensor domain-containing protein/signal transduction histidine kinase